MESRSEQRKRQNHQYIVIGRPVLANGGNCQCGNSRFSKSEDKKNRQQPRLIFLMLLPFMNAWGLHLPESIPNFIFPSIGIIMSVLFLIVSNGYLARSKAISISYQSLIEELPPEYQRKKVGTLYSGAWGEILNWRMGAVICAFMFLALIVIGIVLLCYTIN